jgi:hypothetical protein
VKTFDYLTQYPPLPAAEVLKEYRFWLDSLLSLSERRGGSDWAIFLAHAGERLNERRYREASVRFFLRPWKKNPFVLIDSLVPVKLALAREHRRGSFEFRRHMEELKTVVERQMARRDNSFGTYLSASNFIELYIAEMALETNTALRRQHYRWARQAEAGGKGFYSEPYLHLIQACIDLDRVKEAEEWLIRGFLLFNSVLQRNISGPLMGEPVQPNPPSLAKTQKRMRAFFRKPPNFHHQPVSWSKLRRARLPELRRLLTAYLADPYNKLSQLRRKEK